MPDWAHLSRMIDIYGPDGGVVCVNDRPFRRVTTPAICALEFCGQGTDTFHDSDLCFYHRQVALGYLHPEVETPYDEEARRILKGARV